MLHDVSAYTEVKWMNADFAAIAAVNMAMLIRRKPGVYSIKIEYTMCHVCLQFKIAHPVQLGKFWKSSVSRLVWLSSSNYNKVTDSTEYIRRCYMYFEF